MASTGVSCPRRFSGFGPWKREEGLDDWKDGRCTFCGSITPEAFLSRVFDGERLVPTDKSYKAYIGDYDKFYYQHLSQEQRVEFFTFYKSGNINFAEPGYFYVLPYFIVTT